VSFTRTAAQDLKEKLLMLEARGAKDVVATTLHSLCLRILRKERVFEKHGRNERFLLDHEARLMLYDLEGDFGRIDGREKRLIAYQSGWLTDPNSYYGGLPERESLEFGNQVQRWLLLHGAMLIGEVVPLMFDFLRDNAVRTEIDNLQHLFVDEYQDLNYLEQQLIEFVVDDSIATLFIGDDDQSIYGFKHANPDGIIDQTKRDDSHLITLDSCRRSPRNIVDIANQLIRHAPDRLNKVLTSVRDDDGYLAKVQWPRFEDEIAGIAAAIAYDVSQRRMPAGQILVLVPNRKIGARIRNELARLDIPVKGYFDQETFDDPTHSHRAMAMLQLVANENDLIAWRVLLGLGGDKGSSESYRRLRAEALSRGKSILELLGDMSAGDPLRSTFKKFTEVFTKNTTAIRRLRDSAPNEIVDKLFPDGDQALVDLREIAVSILDGRPNIDVKSLAREMINRLSFNDVDHSPDFVRVMTLHKSKGLTANQVFILGVVESILPNYSGVISGEERVDKVTEARRLLYVGITRTANELVISSFRSVEAGEGLKFGLKPSSPARRSRFSTTSSSLMRELGSIGGRTIQGEDWLFRYSQRK
jgi:superfamily I DNA/RNA helicase